MILIATKNQKLGKQLRKELTASSFPCRILDVGQVDLFKDFYATDVSAVVCDGEFDNLPDGLYVLKLITKSGKVELHKLIKQEN